MDKKQLLAFGLIFLVFIGFQIFMRPSEEQLAAQKRYQDSLSEVYQKKMAAEAEQTRIQDSLRNIQNGNFDISQVDSAQLANYVGQFGKFSNCAVGENQTVLLQNDKIKVSLSTKGAQISNVEILNYKTYDGEPLNVVREDPQNEMSLDFFNEAYAISSKKLYFKYMGNDSELTATEQSPVRAVFRAYVDSVSWLEFAYSLKNDSYLLDYDVTFHNLDNVINRNSSYLNFTWNQFLPVLERGNKWESQHSGLYYKYENEDAESLSLTSDSDEQTLVGGTKWIAYKGQFFSSVLIAKTNFPSSKVAFKNVDVNTNKNFKYMVSSIDFSVADTTRAMCFYFGPNQYKILNNVVLDSQAEDEKELGLEELVPLGWFGIISKWIIIPLFNWLGSFISSYGIIILIMTIIIKIVIFPLTRKSYKSSASMRVLKPQIDEISKKYPKPEQAMEKQKAVMALYQRVGISPMGGCLPLLLQMPILIAMFNFFPSSIELRQQAFLWATDLSSYDSILDLPFTIPFYGNHVSLFTLLMAAAMIVSTKINSSQMDTGQSMAGMKMMMYFMPVMMVCWFNDYSSGLSYYYFLSNIITILQMWIIRKTLDEKAILAKLNSKAAKNSGKKKSGLMARLEEAQRRQMEIMKEQQKKGKRR